MNPFILFLAGVIVGIAAAFTGLGVSAILAHANKDCNLVRV